MSSHTTKPQPMDEIDKAQQNVVKASFPFAGKLLMVAFSIITTIIPMFVFVGKVYHLDFASNAPYLGVFALISVLSLIPSYIHISEEKFTYYLRHYELPSDSKKNENEYKAAVGFYGLCASLTSISINNICYIITLFAICYFAPKLSDKFSELVIAGSSVIIASVVTVLVAHGKI